MKIKKQIITESALVKEPELLEDVTAEDTADGVENEDMIIDDVLSASVSEIANAVQTAKEEESDGEETYTDEKAKEIAKKSTAHLEEEEQALLNEENENYSSFVIEILTKNSIRSFAFIVRYVNLSSSSVVQGSNPNA